MASPYDEYERSLTGRWKEGLSPVAWALVALLGVFLLGGIVFAAAATFALKQAQDVVVEVIESTDEPVVIKLDDLDDLRNLRHELRKELRHELRSTEVREAIEAARSAEVRRAIAAARSNSVISANAMAEQVLEELENEFEGSMTFVIDGETLELDMSGNEDGAVFLLDAGGESYSLTIDNLEDGARLLVTTPDGESEFKAGSTADAPPNWVPRYPGSAHPEAVFSGDVNGTEGGAELFVTQDSPLDVVQHLTEALESDGFDVRVERLSLGSDDVQGSLVGTRESDGRAVAVMVVEEDGETKILTLWGDESII